MKIAASAVTLVLMLTGCAGSTEPSTTEGSGRPSAVGSTEPSTTGGSGTPSAVEEAEPAARAQEVVDAFVAAGLPARNPRDNTPQNCGTLSCAALVTTDDITVVVFTDRQAQQKYVDAFKAFAAGTIVLQYTAARTPEELRPKYQAVLQEVVAGD